MNFQCVEKIFLPLPLPIQQTLFIYRLPLGFIGNNFLLPHRIITATRNFLGHSQPWMYVCFSQVCGGVVQVSEGLL
jgi:hypothetical protein